MTRALDPCSCCRAPDVVIDQLPSRCPADCSCHYPDGLINLVYPDKDYLTQLEKDLYNV